MPWSPEDAPKHKKGLSARGRRQWADVANSALRKCMEEGGTEATCAASAIRQANGVAGNEDMELHSSVQTFTTTRIIQHQGRSHLVAPVVMMTEGVHNGSHGALFHSASELGRFVGAWNGMPVVVQHPHDEEGFSISANHPDVIDSELMGRVYNARMDGSRLCGEIWMDINRLRSAHPEVLDLIQSGSPLDVSIGVFTDDDLTPGVWNEEEYVGVARNHRPDHLALLPNGQGACSWQDGCGVRANSENVKPENAEGGEQNLEDIELLSSAAINDLPDSAFAYIEPGGRKDDGGKTVPRSLRHFPIHDAPHVRNALARLNQSPFGAKAKKKVLAAAKKFGIEVSGNEENVADFEKDLLQQGFFLTQTAVGYREIMSAIQTKLDRMDDDVKVHFLTDVYDNFFIYEVRGRMGSPFSGSGLYKRNYTVSSNGAVEFTGEPSSVRREVSYVTNSQDGGNVMAEKVQKKCCPEKVMALITNENTPYQEADKEWLESLEEQRIDQLTVFAESVVKEEEEKEETPPATNEEEAKEEVKKPEPVTVEQAVNALQERLGTINGWLEIAPDEIRDTMVSALKLHNEKRAELIKLIKNNSKFTEEQLKAKKMDELAVLADMARTRDYTAMVGGGVTVHKSGSGGPLLPTGVGVSQKGGK